MPPQSVEVAETIIALKRALRREKEPPTDQQISSATNRGNKLKRGAGFVHSGSLPYRYSSHGLKERIEHAGYQRYILSRTPKRYNEYGDELEDSESDEEADADADDENPYSDIRLEELLRPLSHPAELENHPTLSQAYLDPTLIDMVKTTEEKLRIERANLWRAKNLHRSFIGDESWMPCERVEQADDWDLFEPHVYEPRSSPGRKRKRDAEIELDRNGIEVDDHAEHAADLETKPEATVITNGEGPVHPTGADTEGTDPSGQKPQDKPDTEDRDMADVEAPKQNGIHVGKKEADNATAQEGDDSAGQPPPDQNNSDQPAESTENQNAEDEDMDDASDAPPVPTRRITRALAATNTSNSAAPSTPSSPTNSTLSSLEEDSSLYHPHNMFLLPISLSTAHATHASNLPLHVAHSGLPIDEILETRRLLGMYIQKQEETIRGLENLLGKLIKAKLMRDRVWEWSKAEGHVGEWSDGEDWVDCEAWSIDPQELRKGKDEENVEEEQDVAGGRKGKRRRGAKEKEKE